MSELRVDWLQMRYCAQQFSSCQHTINQCIDQITHAKRQIAWQIRIQTNITYRLDRSIDQMRSLCATTGRMSDVLEYAAAHYRETETRNAQRGCSLFGPVLDWTDRFRILAGGGSFGGGAGGGGFRDVGGSDKLWEGAVFAGSGAIGATILGVSAAGSASYEVLGGSVDTYGKAKWDLEDGEFGAMAGFKADGHVLEGKVEGQLGDTSASLEGQVLTGTVTGAIGLSLMKDSVFAPSVRADLKAEGSVLHGEAELQQGSDTFNTHSKAEGDVLHGEAKLNLGAGVITRTNDDGSVEECLGAEAKVSAEGYVFSGEVSQGVTIFGIKIDATLEGNALGAGVDAGASMTTNSFSGKIGAGLGIGAGLEISVDWSDFQLPDWDDFWKPDWNNIFPW